MGRGIVSLAVLIGSIVLWLAGCATYRYVPGAKEAETACAAEAREAVRRATPWSEVGVTALLGEAYTAQARTDPFMAAFTPCMTARGFPPGTAVKERVERTGADAGR